MHSLMNPTPSILNAKPSALNPHCVGAIARVEPAFKILSRHQAENCNLHIRACKGSWLAVEELKLSYHRNDTVSVFGFRSILSCYNEFTG